MGSKTRARELMQRRRRADRARARPTRSRRVEDARTIIDEEIGYPVAVKAAGGGGGKGFRVALDESELQDAFEGAAREGEKFFSDATVYLERYLPDPRHVEVQVLADRHGNVIHLGERDCSVQRRHQKLIEESPGARRRRGAARADRQDRRRRRRARSATSAPARSRACSQDGEYFFLEMNTRVQVEHCVTEMVTGIDIVREGIRAAAGEALSFGQDDVVLRGHAIECRINAEDASKNFAPAPGAITQLPRAGRAPACASTPASTAGSEITPMYDPMVAKLIVWDADREQATARMLRALGEYEIGGLKTLIPFHSALLATEQWARGETCRDLLEDREWLKRSPSPKPAAKAERRRAREASSTPTPSRSPAASSTSRSSARRSPPAAPGRAGGARGAGARGRAQRPRGRRRGGGGDELVSPLQGNLWKVLVEQGQTVEEGQLVCIIEAMKMENEITAHKAGVIERAGGQGGRADHRRRDDRRHQERRLRERSAPDTPP